MNIDDELLRDAKKQAASEGRTLGELISDSLRERLARRTRSSRTRYSAVTAGDGGPLPGVDITNNAATRDLLDAA